MDTSSKKIKFISKIKNFSNFFLDLIFPKYCVGCNKEGVWLCQKCKNLIIVIKKSFCASCQKLTPKGQYCSKCRQKYYLTGVIIAAHYEKKCVLKEAVHTYKYDHIKNLKYALAPLLINALYHRNFSKNLIILPVPLSKQRIKQRGYNQSEELAKVVAIKTSSKLITKKLIRIKNKTRQADLPRAKRLENIKGVFDWIGKNELKNKRVFLIDDVYTTGATVNECAKVLRQKAKAREVWAVVLGKG